jgi:ribokinase
MLSDSQQTRRKVNGPAMANSSIIVLGSINTDFVVRGPKLPAPGETVLGGTFYEAPGGKGANQAVAAARLAREPVTFIAAVGSDRLGSESLTRLRGENIACDYIQQIDGAASGVALILVDEQGENLISVASGANALLSPGHVDLVPEVQFAAARLFLASLESPLASVGRGLERAKQHGLATVLNPAPATSQAADSALLELVDILTPNEHELATLTGLACGSDDELIQAARALQSLGARAVVVTLGRRGACVVDERATWIEAIRVPAVDTTAAGDAFSGGLSVALAEGLPLVEAARFATLAAALTVQRAGAQTSLPRRDEVECLARTHAPAVR